MTVRVRQLARVCPSCEAPPRLRVAPAFSELRLLDPGRILLTYQCHRCSHVFPIRAGDWQRVGFQVEEVT